VTDLDPEAAFVGSLLHLPPATACEALRLVVSDDFTDAGMALIADVCRELAGRGIAPDPTAVHAYVRARALVTGVEALRAFTLTLVDVYGACATPASWRFYAVAFLEESLRRRCTMLATRIGQAAEGESIESLTELVDAEAQAVHAVQERRATAAGTQAPARLTAVSA
jgi:replicative DNA helicase